MLTTTEFVRMAEILAQAAWRVNSRRAVGSLAESLQGALLPHCRAVDTWQVPASLV